MEPLHVRAHFPQEYGDIMAGLLDHDYIAVRHQVLLALRGMPPGNLARATLRAFWPRPHPCRETCAESHLAEPTVEV